MLFCMKQLELDFTNCTPFNFSVLIRLKKINKYEQKMGWPINAGYAGITNGNFCFHYSRRITFLLDWVWNRFGNQPVYTFLTPSIVGSEIDESVLGWSVNEIKETSLEVSFLYFIYDFRKSFAWWRNLFGLDSGIFRTAEQPVLHQSPLILVWWSL